MSYLGVPPFGQTVRTVTTATANGTADTFYPTGGYIVGYLDTFYNGVRVVEHIDYTASDGVSIVFGTAPLDGAVIEMVSYGPISMVDAVRKSGDTMNNTLVVQDVIPTSNNTYSLGNTTNRFANLYLSGNTIVLGSQIISANSTHITFANTTGGTPNTSISGSSVTVVDSVSNTSTTAAASANSVRTAYQLAANGVTNTYVTDTFVSKSNAQVNSSLTITGSSPIFYMGNNAYVTVSATYGANNTDMYIVSGNNTVQGVIGLSKGMVTADNLQLGKYSYPLQTYSDVSTQTINFEGNHHHYIYNTNGTLVFDFANMPVQEEYKEYFFRIFLNQGSTPRVPTAQINGSNKTIMWQNGVTPTPSANTYSQFDFHIIRLNTTWSYIFGSHISYS